MSLLRNRRMPVLHLLAAAALVLASSGAGAADSHDAPPAEAKPAAKASAKADPHAASAPNAAAPAAAPAAAAKASPAAAAKRAADPMDSLREKLAEKLGATPAPSAASPYVVRVVAKAESGGHGSPAATAPRAKADTAALVAKLRSEKAAEGHAGGAAHWGYGGPAGPEAWANLKPEFATCGTGERQSPIDIRGGVKVDLEPIQFDYRPTGFRVLDNGHTVQVNLASGNSIEILGRRYELLQFHFHRPSEERIDGRQFDMVAHLVHKDAEGRLAVVAVLLDRGTGHPLVQTVWNNLPLEKGEEVAAGVSLDLNNLLPQDRRYYTYMGSLTTPPCSEGVLWMVLRQPVPISPEQVGIFSRLYPMNARPIQSASGRLIKQSN